MNLGVLEIALLGGGYVLALVLVLWWAFGARRNETADWAKAHALALTGANRPFVEYYLRTGRSLRALGVIGGLLLPAAVRQAVDPTPPTGFRLSLLGALAGYLIGTLWSELALTRPTTSGPRAASLTPRRRDEYLPAILRWAPRVIAAAAVAGWTLVVLLRHHRGPDTTTAPVDLRSALGWIAVIALTPLVIEVVQRWILQRPQPMVVPDLVAADDAVRSQSLHMLAGTGSAIELCWLITPLWRLAEHVSGRLHGFLAACGLLSALAAIWFWRYYSHRAWRVRRTLPAGLTRPAAP